MEMGRYKERLLGAGFKYGGVCESLVCMVE